LGHGFGFRNLWWMDWRWQWRLFFPSLGFFLFVFFYRDLGWSELGDWRFSSFLFYLSFVILSVSAPFLEL
jgi:hypothetical protein